MKRANIFSMLCVLTLATPAFANPHVLCSALKMVNQVESGTENLTFDAEGHQDIVLNSVLTLGFEYRNGSMQVALASPDSQNLYGYIIADLTGQQGSFSGTLMYPDAKGFILVNCGNAPVPPAPPAL